MHSTKTTWSLFGRRMFLWQSTQSCPRLTSDWQETGPAPSPSLQAPPPTAPSRSSSTSPGSPPTASWLSSSPWPCWPWPPSSLSGFPLTMQSRLGSMLSYWCPPPSRLKISTTASRSATTPRNQHNNLEFYFSTFVLHRLLTLGQAAACFSSLFPSSWRLSLLQFLRTKIRDAAWPALERGRCQGRSASLPGLFVRAQNREHTTNREGGSIGFL